MGICSSKKEIIKKIKEHVIFKPFIKKTKG